MKKLFSAVYDDNRDKSEMCFRKVQFPAVLLRPAKTNEELVFMEKKRGTRMGRNDRRDERTQVQHYLSAAWLTDCEQVF